MLSNTEERPLSGGRLQSSHARPQRLRKTRRNLVPGCVFFRALCRFLRGQAAGCHSGQPQNYWSCPSCTTHQYAARLLCLVSSVFFVSPFVLSVTFDLFCRVSGITSLPWGEHDFMPVGGAVDVRVDVRAYLNGRGAPMYQLASPATGVQNGEEPF